MNKGKLNVLALSEPGIGRREFMHRVSMALMAFGLSACGRMHTRSLNIYNYSNYLGQNSLANFKKLHPDISIVYDEFSSQDVLFAKLKLGAGYDLVVVTDYMLRRLIRQDLLAPIGPEFKHAHDYMDMFKQSPWNDLVKYCVPYLWGTTGIGYNTKKVKEIPKSWKAMWDPHYSKRITMLDEKRDAIGIALVLLGFDGNSTNPEELAKAKQLLIKQKPLLRQYTTDYIDGLARNEIWLAQGWSGDIAQARKSNPDVDYYLPDEGSFIFVDSWCIPKSAENKAEAVEFLNYVMDPKLIAQVTNATFFPNTMKSSKPYVSKELIDKPLCYPPEDMMKRTFLQTDIGGSEKVWDQIWEEIKFDTSGKS